MTVKDRMEFRVDHPEKLRWQEYATSIGWSCGHLIREAMSQIIARQWLPEVPVVEPPTVAGLDVGAVERELRERGWIGDDE